MKFFKQIKLFIIIGLSLFIFGCESTNDIRTAYFSNITSAVSSNNTIRVTLQSDKRVDEKFFDIQVRSNEEVSLQVYEENGTPINIFFDDTKWKSLTSLMLEGQGKAGTETFKKYSDVQSQTYIFVSSQEAELTFRLVVGEVEENASGKGYILSNSKDVSKEFKIRLKKS